MQSHGVTAGCRGSDRGTGLGHGGPWEGRPEGLEVGDGQVGGGDPLPRGHGSRRTWPQAQSLVGARRPLEGEPAGALRMPTKPGVPPQPHPTSQCHHGLPPSPRLTLGWPAAFRAQGQLNYERLEKAEGL